MDGVPRRFRERLTRRHAGAQGVEARRAQAGHHRAICGGRRRQHGDAVALDGLEQVGRRRLLEKVDRRARPHREDDALAQPKGEGQRRARREEVVRGRLQHVVRERVRDGEDVAMKMHRRLRLPGRARCEGEHAHVVGRGRDVLELGLLGCRHLRQVIRVVAPVGEDLGAIKGGGVQVFDEAVVADRHGHAGDVHHRLELTRPKQRHRGHRDSSGLDDAEPARHQPWVVRAAEQHPVAWDQAHLVHQRVGDLVGPGQEVRVRPFFRVRHEAAPGSGSGLDVTVEQLGRAVQRWRVLELGKREQEFRPRRSGREVFPGEGVYMRRS